MITDLSKYEGKAIMLTNQESQVENKFYISKVVVIPISMDMFHNMGSGNYYPDKGLTNTIAHGSGIEFFPSIRMTDTYGDEVTHPDGTKTRKATGKECTKQGRKMKPDGTWHPSSPCPYEFNYVDRAELDLIGKNVTDIQKRKKILELKKFATQRASTGAELVVIRELLGTNTSFSKSEIELGKIVVSRIEKTEELQAELALADVEARRNGGAISDRIDRTAALLTGGSVDNSDFENNFVGSEKQAEQEKSTPEKTGHKTPPDFKSEVDPVVNEKKIINGLLDDIKADEGTRKYYIDVLDNAKWIEAAYKWAVEEIEKTKGEIK